MDVAGEEPDYLAKAQLEKDPLAFPQAVREAFELEYGTRKLWRIAEIIGRDKSRVSQMLGDPTKVEAGSVKHLVSFLRSAPNRERVVRAWVRDCFPDSAGPHPPSDYLSGTADASTLKRIDRLVREGQLQIASGAAWEAARMARDPSLREMFLDRAYFARQRLDQPGQAMSVAALIAVRARRRREHDREAGALFMRCRILLGLADAEPGELLGPLDAADALLDAAGPTGPKPYVTPSKSTVGRLRANCRLTLMERGRLPLDERFVRALLAELLRSAGRERNSARRFGTFNLAARCHLLLKQTFQAEELLERAFQAGGPGQLNRYELAGLLRSRIMAETATPKERAEYLDRVVDNCVKEGDAYHRRLAEWDLARAQALRFPEAAGS